MLRIVPARALLVTLCLGALLGVPAPVATPAAAQLPGPKAPADAPGRPEVPPLRLEKTGSDVSGPCEDCGKMTTKVWGNVRDRGAVVAVYFVDWTPGHLPIDANFDLILGPMGQGTKAADRSAVSMLYRVVEGKPGFMVIDSAGRPTGRSKLAGRALSRKEVIGTPTASRAFDVVDAVLLGDDRVAELRAK